MKSLFHILLLAAIVSSVSVSAKAPPGHGVVKESKNKACPDFGYTPIVQFTFAVSAMDVMHGRVISYIEPVRNWQYVEAVPSLYTAPYVEKIDAFYARNSC